MKVQEKIPINNIYIGLQIEEPINNPNIDKKLKITTILKTPKFLKNDKNTQIYKDIHEEKFYYLMIQDDNYVSKNTDMIHSTLTSFKRLKSLDRILNRCANKFNHEPKLSKEKIEYLKSIEIIKRIGYLTINQLKDFEKQIFNIYCYAYGNPIEKENNKLQSSKRNNKKVLRIIKK